MTCRIACALPMVAAVLFAGNATAASKAPLDRCVVVTSPGAPGPVGKASEMLCDEIAKRTGLRLHQRSALPEGDVSAIVLGLVGAMPVGSPQLPAGLVVPHEAEGYAIWVDTTPRKAPIVCVTGRDTRGALFGVGRLLRALHMKAAALTLDVDFRISTAPAYPVRGHELGYRNKSNTYDAWTVAQYEQYIRDLAVFGANGVQLVVQLDSMDKDGPHMTETVSERSIKLARLLGDYGLRVWIWLAPSEKAITPETAPVILDKCRAFFEQCAPIDAIFVPGGDPGDTPPEVLLPLLKDIARLLRASHPGAEVWLSNEDMSHEWNGTLFRSLSQEQPEWLTGMVFGTWVKLSLQEMRAQIPAKYPIVQYPDITHSIECQYPAHNLDRAFAFTLGREAINPRPIAMALIYDKMARHTIGFSSYSDGVNDDVNKIIWTALAWDPKASVTEILEEYGRYFVGEEFGGEMAKGLLDLERNWQGPLLKNAGVERTLARWKRIERRAENASETNWRLQMALFRANYDAYVRRKLIAETAREREARKALRSTGNAEVSVAVARAERVLAAADSRPDAPELRARIEQLGDALFRNIGMQLSVPKYGAANWERGAVLDALDAPLSDRPWLESQFKEIVALPSEPARIERLETVLNWEIPGRGAYYDDLGNSSKQPHLVHQKEWKDDPGFVESPQNEFIEADGRKAWRRSWRDQGQTLYGTPLRMRYEKLDPNAAYTLRIVYTGRFRSTMRLIADGNIEIHGPLPQPKEPRPLEFAVPKEAVADGTLNLQWDLVPGTGRGCQVAEVWLLRTPG